MLKIINILLLIYVFFAYGCRTIPDGTPPQQTVNINVSYEKNGEITISEAVNLISTALAVEVFAGRKGTISILFKNNPAAAAVTRRVYQELKLFLPVKSVLADEDFVLESSVGKTAGKKYVWQLNLKNRKNKILWNEIVFLKDGEIK